MSKTLDRVAFSPGEFAKMFGKSQTWGYRQIYDGKITAITEHGRILIPAKEVERILQSAGIYNGRPKPKRGKEPEQKLSVEQQSVWQSFVELRRQKREAVGQGTNTACMKKVYSPSPGKRLRPPARIAGQWQNKLQA